ncbi:DUF6501 family protein [Alkalihalobacillus trypoxylicola]|uniref:Uncharacterized protein n=1 Tax=Alkalihalobacillus trypoxylicola TaxID=519424 RepID=A0A161QAK5_9BACI|nr:DUF6501 family protein [Alkalihalobacillus trypoxylicola]KYG34857.1 hypothetical protein AZF04_00545 [Alkalihalobacillus trypoxylicola]GAF64508.1 hypothetical protein BTS2_1401 [Bacillus sp. TS-2]
MIHHQWENTKTIRSVTCIHTNAKKYKVSGSLTEGKSYELKNETEEFYFVIDNTGKIGGYYKEYFQN